MPIERTTHTSSPDNLGLLLAHLWHRIWLLIMVGAVVTIATYFVMRLLPEEFRVRAEIYVNQLNVFDEPVSAEAVATLLKSDGVLRAVRDRFVQKYGGEPPVFERFVAQFETTTKVLQDTAVKRAVSPIVNLTVKGRGREETLFLMDAWTSTFVAEFGDYSSREARIKLAAAQREEAALEARLREEEKAQADAATQLALKEKVLAAKLNLLSPAELTYSPVTRPSMPLGIERDSNNFQVAVTPSRQGTDGLGLYGRLAEAELAIAQAVAAGAMETDLATSRSLTAGLRVLIADTESSISELLSEVAGLQQQFSSSARRIAIDAAALRELHRFVDRVHAVAATAQTVEADGEGVAGDMRILSDGVMPELRVWPKRSIVAVVVGIMAVLLTIFMIAFRRYIQSVERGAAA